MYETAQRKGKMKMKNKKIFFIFLGAFAVFFIGATVFFMLQGLLAANKRQEYFDVYRSQAVEYIKSSTEIKSKYGEDISVKFDDTVTYSPSGERGFFDKYIEVFRPQIPDTIEEFSESVDMIQFNVRINGDKYEVIFEKNNQGSLDVSKLTDIKD